MFFLTKTWWCLLNLALDHTWLQQWTPGSPASETKWSLGAILCCFFSTWISLYFLSGVSQIFWHMAKILTYCRCWFKWLTHGSWWLLLRTNKMIFQTHKIWSSCSWSHPKPFYIPFITNENASAWYTENFYLPLHMQPYISVSYIIFQR